MAGDWDRACRRPTHQRGSLTGTCHRIYTGETSCRFRRCLNLWTRWTLVAGGLLITALVFGMALRSDWEALSIQMLYAIIYDLLLAARTYGYFALDMLRTKRPGPSTTAPESKCATRPRRAEGLVPTPTRVNRTHAHESHRFVHISAD